MVFITNRHVKRTPAQKAIRFLTGIVAVTLIVFVLSQIPYDILREERFRLYGETRTTGIVTARRTDGTEAIGSKFVLIYKYIDQDGYTRQYQSPMPRKEWERYRPGSRIEVYFAQSKPGLARVAGEIEPPFQLWLRRMLQ